MQLNEYRSGWAKIRSSVSKGSVLRPFLFKTFINHIDEEALCEISKFASKVKTLNDKISAKDFRQIGCLGKSVGNGF